MKKRNLWILTAVILVVAMSLCMVGCKQQPTVETTPTEAAAAAQTQPTQATEPATEPAPAEATVPEETGVQVGDLFRISKLAATQGDESGVSFYHTANGKNLTAFEEYDQSQQKWHSNGVEVYPCTDYDRNWGEVVTSSSRYAVVAYEIPATGAIQLHTRTRLLGSNGYTVKVALGSPENVVGEHKVTGWKDLDYRYGYGLKVTEGETLYMIYEPESWKDGDSLAFANYVVYTGMGPKAEPIDPVNQPLLSASAKVEPLTIRFTDIVGKKNGMNGLTFYYTSDGVNLTPLANYDEKEGKWYKGTDGVLVYPCLVKKDNYGLFGSSASEYIVMGYKLPATGTIDLFTWAALQGDGIDYQVRIAKNSPTNYIASFDVRGSANTVDYRNTVLDVKRGDVLYIHYKPLQAVNGAWGGYNTIITYTSGGGDYKVFDPYGFDSDGTGETIPFTTLVEPGKNGENGLTFYYTADGKQLAPFTDYEASEGKWYHGGTGTLIYPVMEAEANYGLVGSSSTEYVALGYEITKKGTIDLYTWFALQSGHDYQIRIAKGTPDNILYAYDVVGESQTVVEKTTRLNVDEGDTIYVLYKPLEVEDGAWGGNKVALTWVSVGTHTGPADPERIVPDDLKEGAIKAGDKVYFAQTATETNGDNGVTYYHTADGKELNAFTESTGTGADFRWYDGEDGVLVYPANSVADNYGIVGTSAAEYVALSYKVPETGTVKLDTYMVLQSGHDYQIRIAKGTPDKILYAYDVKGNSQTEVQKETELNVTKDDMLYILYKPLENENEAWAGYKNVLTWVSVGTQTGPADPEPIDPDAGGNEEPEEEVKVGDTFKSAELAPAHTNGQSGMTYYYTTDGQSLTPFSTYDPGNHNGRWYHNPNGTLAFVDPFVDTGANYGWIGTSASEYVVVGYEMPASGTIDLYNWVAIHTGHDCKVTVAQGTLDNVVAAYDVTGPADTILEKTDSLTVTKGEEIFVIYEPVEKTATADSCYYGYKTQYTYTAVTDSGNEEPDPDPSVSVGDVVKFAEAATTTNGDNNITYYYTQNGKNLSAFTDSTGTGADFHWYSGGSGLLVYPANSVANNYGIVGSSASEYVAMAYKAPATGTVKVNTYMILQSEHDHQVRIAKGTPDNILYTMDVKGNSLTQNEMAPVLNVNKDDVIYILYKPLEAANGAWGGYKTSLEWVSVGTQTGPADPDKIVPDDLKPQEPENPNIAPIDDGVTKILTIGNSFTVDTMEYVHKIAASAGVTNLQLGKIVIGGSSVDDHYSNAMGNAASYEYGKSTENGGWLTTYNNTMKDVLLAENWDYVMIQQHSPNAGNAESFANLNGLLDYIGTYIHDDSQIIWNMTWAYQSDSTHEAFVQYNRDQMTMYNAIVTTAQSVLVPNEKIALIVPNATSIQNARTSYVGDTLTMDGYHLSRDQGRYIAAMTFAKVALGVDPAAVTYTPAGVSDVFRQMTVEAVNNAVAKPFEVTNSTFTAGTVDTSNEVRRPTQEFASLATTTNGGNGLTFYYTTDGQNLVAYTDYDATQGRWYDNSENQLNMFDPAEVVANNYGLGQCSDSKYVAMGYKASETGSLDLFALTVIQGPEGSYSYNVRIAVGDPENTVHQYTVTGQPGFSQEERYTLDVTKDQEIYIIYENLTSGGWFGYKNSATWRTAATEDPDEPEIQVGDTFKSAELAPVNTNGTGMMTYYYTADGQTLTPFSTYDPANHNGRWYRYTTDMLAFVDPFVNTGDNYGWIGTSASEYVVVGYEMPASGTIDLYNWLALHTGHDCKVLIAQGTVDNIVKTYDVTGAVDTILEKTDTLTVTKGEEIFVIYQPIESTASANSCYYGYKTQFTYTAVGESGGNEPDPTPSVAVGDVVKFSEAATTTNGANGLTFGYTADGKTVTAYTAYAPETNNGRWYSVANDAVQTFVDPFAIAADNYGLVGTADDAYVAMEYVVPETGTVELYTWLALQSGHDYQIRIAKGTPDNILYTYDVTGEGQTAAANRTQLNVTKNDKLYILYKPLEAEDNAYAGYINQLTWVSVGEQTGPADPTPIVPDDLIVSVGEEVKFAEAATATNGENGLTLYYTNDGKNLTAFTAYAPNGKDSRWYNAENEQVLSFVDPIVNVADNYGRVGTSTSQYVVMGYEVPATGTVELYNWLALHSAHDYEIGIAKNSVENVLYTYKNEGGTDNILEKTTTLNVERDDVLYIIYKPLEAADGAYCGYKTSLKWVSVGSQTGPADPVPEGTGQQLTVAQNMAAANETMDQLAEDAGLAALSVDVNLKPVGALSNATASSAYTDGKAVFTYQSGETTVEYIVDTTRDSVKNGLIEILTRRNGGEEVISVTGAGLGYTTSTGAQLTPAELANTAVVEMQAQFDKSNGHLYLDYQETSEGITSTKRYDFFMMGKSLAVQVTSSSERGTNGYAYFTTGSAQGLNSPRIDNTMYCEEVSITVVDNTYFLSAYLDKAKTFSTLVENDPSASATGTVHGMTAYYERNSAGETNPVNELFYVTVSDDFLDCAYLTNGQKSQYRDTLNELVIYDSWDNSQSYAQREEYLTELFEKYNFQDVLVVDHRWQRDTLDVSNPAHYPASTYWGSAEEFDSYITTVKDTLGWDLALHEDYWFMQPSESNQYWNAEGVKDNLAQNADGSLRYGWQDTSYANLSNMMAKYAQIESPKIEQAYNPSASFLDVSGGVDPSEMNQVTLNANSTTSRTLAQVVADNALLFQTARDIYGGPVISEGAQGERSFGSAYAGFLDAGSREITGGNDCRIMPDYELIYIRAKMANQGMGPPARFQTDGDVDTYDFDKLNAVTLAYGHAGFIGETHYSTELVEDELVNAYYMFRAIQPQYLDSTVTVREISYFTTSGTKLDLDAAILADYNFKQARLYIRYSNGLEMYLNFSDSNWDVTLNGHSYTLDKNGYAAENPNQEFVQYSCLLNGVRVDFVSSKLYTYANPRGNLVDFGNGLITSQVVINGKGQSIPFTSLVKSGENGANGLTFYYTANGKDYTAFTDYVQAEGKWYHGGNGTLTYPAAVPENNYALIGSSATEYTAMGYKVTQKGTVSLNTSMVLQSGHDYQIRIAKGTPDNILYTYDVTGDAGADLSKDTVLNVNKDDVLYIIYKPLEVADGAWAGVYNTLTWVSVGEQTGPADPEKIVPDDLKDGVKVGDVVNFSRTATTTNGENGLTFGYTADGKTVTAYTNYGDTNGGRWYSVANDAVQTFVDPFIDVAANYGLIGTNDDTAVTMEYAVPETGTVKLYTWLALQSGNDYQIRIAKGTPDNILYTYDVKGEGNGATIVEKYTDLNVNKNDKLYIIYKPLEAGKDAWAGFKNSLTWVSVGNQTGPADPDKIVPDDLKPTPSYSVAVGDVVKFAQIATATNGENGLSYYYTADGKTCTAFAEYVQAEGKWYHGGTGTLIYPANVPANNYAVIGTSSTEYTALGYKMPETGTVSLNTAMVLQSGHDYQIRIAKGTPDNILYTYDVTGAAGASLSKDTVLNVNKDDVLYILYKPLEVADGAWAGVYNTLTWVSVGNQTGPTDPDKIVPDDLKPAPDPEPEYSVKVGDTFTAAALMPTATNGEKGMSIYHTANGTSLSGFSGYEPSVNGGRWWYSTDAGLMAFIDPFVDAGANYGWVGTSEAAYVVMEYVMPEAGTVTLTNWLAPHKGIGCSLQIAKGTPDNVVKAYDIVNVEAVQYEDVLNVAKGEKLYVIFKPMQGTPTADTCYFGYKTWYTYTAVG